MANKKQYYKLDDIGFVGTQEKRSPAQVKVDALRTANIIKAMKKSKKDSTVTNHRRKVTKVK
jgi:hypothetical protein